MHPDQHLSDSANNPPEAEPRGLPYLPVGLGILALLVVILIAAVLLNRQFRPPVGVATVPAGAGQSSVTATPMQSPTVLAVVPATTPSPAVPPTATVTPTLVSPTPPPSATASAAVTSTTPTLTAPEATATALGIPLTLQTPVVEPGTTGNVQELEQEIRAAYLHYWDVRTEAYLNLDTSHLSEVMAGAELERVTQQIQELKAQNKPSKFDVEHHISFALIGDDQATIYDPYLDKSVWVDPVTKQPIPTSEPPSIVKISFSMKKIDGVWKVVDGVLLP